MKKILYSALIFLFFACDSSIKKDPTPIPVNLSSDHLALGNPNNATINILMPDNYLIIRNEYATSYNNSKGHANWTAWNLTNAWLGSVSRQEDFRADTDLPEGFLRVGSSDYNGAVTGFDRGHLCPSGDRTATAQANSMTFLMTNMIPQAPKNNQQIWAGLEDYTRTLVANGTMECYIFAGAYGRGGTSTIGGNVVNSIGGGRINVPARTWKIVVLMPIGTNDATRITASTRVIAVDMPNREDISSNGATNSTAWKTYRVTVRSLEQATGFNFLSNVPQNIQDAIETTTDTL